QDLQTLRDLSDPAALHARKIYRTLRLLFRLRDLVPKFLSRNKTFERRVGLSLPSQDDRLRHHIDTTIRKSKITTADQHLIVNSMSAHKRVDPHDRFAECHSLPHRDTNEHRVRIERVDTVDNRKLCQ